MTLNTSNPARFYAVIPCAGSGSRAGSVLPKQYQDIAGMPMVVHTIKAFAGVPRITGGLLVLAPDDVHMEVVQTRFPQNLFHCVRTGGASRVASVVAGLQALREIGAQDEDWVLVHDAARCLVTSLQINSLIDACNGDAIGGLLAHKLADTLKTEVNGRVEQTVDRSDKWLAQTPQMFRLGALLMALERAISKPVSAVNNLITDESSAMELMGLSPKLVEGSAENFKVTYPQDFALAESILKSRSIGNT
jgi:2-C-methyl-D-erythritol 4-phosphate cytidylyltransferase